MKHTPGPWNWEADPVKGDPYERVRYQVTTVGKTITRIYRSSFEGGPTNAEADAKLISAAPDMAEALLCLLNAAHEVDLTHGDCFWGDSISKARAALAKAGL